MNVLGLALWQVRSEAVAGVTDWWQEAATVDLVQHSFPAAIAHIPPQPHSTLPSFHPFAVSRNIRKSSFGPAGVEAALYL